MSDGLFALPLELRDAIIELVIRPSVDPSAITAIYEREPRRRCHDFRFDEDFRRVSNWYLQDPKSYVPNADGLLLANRQLRAECLSRLEALQQPHSIDIQVVDTKFLFPTWSCIPQSLNPHIRTLNATVQAAGVWPEHSSDRGFFKFRRPGLMQMSFSALLVRFLLYGAVAPLPKEDPDRSHVTERRITINTLNIDIRSPGDPEKFPEGLAEYIAKYMREYLAMPLRWYPVKYGDILFRRIGEIRIIVDGAHYETVDVARQLAYVPQAEKRASGPGWQSEEELHDWFVQVCEKRIEAGLKAPPEGCWERFDSEEMVAYREGGNIM